MTPDGPDRRAQADRLTQLAELYRQGLLSDSEYQAAAERVVAHSHSPLLPPETTDHKGSATGGQSDAGARKTRDEGTSSAPNRRADSPVDGVAPRGRKVMIATAVIVVFAVAAVIVFFVGNRPRSTEATNTARERGRHIHGWVGALVPCGPDAEAYASFVAGVQVTFRTQNGGVLGSGITGSDIQVTGNPTCIAHAEYDVEVAKADAYYPQLDDETQRGPVTIEQLETEGFEFNMLLNPSLEGG